MRDKIHTYLLQHPGERFLAADMATYFACSPDTIRHHAGRLANEGLIKVERKSKWASYWAESPDERRMTTAQLPRITSRPYVMPSAMLDRVREISEQRQAFPSKLSEVRP